MSTAVSPKSRGARICYSRAKGIRIPPTWRNNFSARTASAEFRASIRWMTRRSNAWALRSASTCARTGGRNGGEPRVLIGRDTRESGPHIAAQIARGLSAAGAEPVSAGVLTTPGVAWLVSREGFSAGVVISASHNPYHDNGVKLISSSGMKFPDAVEAEIEGVILSASRSQARSPPRKNEEDRPQRRRESCTRIIWRDCARPCSPAPSSRE